MLTRSGVRPKRMVIHSDSDKLPENVLLEISEAYRHDMELQPQYEDIWNRRHGWFKLAHVCQHWRRVVFSSPSRLDVHLLINPSRHEPSKDWEYMLRCLPSLPIWVDYGAPPCQPPKHREDNLALAALLAAMEDPGRVRRIALRACQSRLLKALRQPFPELKSFGIFHDSALDRNLILSTTFLSGFAQSLRRLTL